MTDDLHKLQQALAKYVMRVGAIALLLLLGVNLAMGAVLWANIRVVISAQLARVVATEQKVVELSGSSARREQVVDLSDKMKDVEGAAFHMRGAVDDIKREQNRLDAMIALISGNITALTTRVTEESKGRDLLIEQQNKVLEAIIILNERLDKR